MEIKLINKTNNMSSIFGSTKYKESDYLTKLLRKANTADDKKSIQIQIDYIRGGIKVAERE
ncbi:MAG: hypothetical protein ACYDA4_15805 [Ignavibacteriaceae bacterium]